MDELTLDQAWNNVATAAAAFQGNQQQWNVLNASMVKVDEAVKAALAPSVNANGKEALAPAPATT